MENKTTLYDMMNAKLSEEKLDWKSIETVVLEKQNKNAPSNRTYTKLSYQQAKEVFSTIPVYVSPGNETYALHLPAFFAYTQECVFGVETDAELGLDSIIRLPRNPKDDVPYKV